MDFIYADNDEKSKWSKKAQDAKKANTKEFWPTMRECIAHDLETLDLKSFRRWATVACIPLANNSRMWKPITNVCSVAMDDKDFYDMCAEEWVGIEDEFQKEYQIFDDLPFSAHRCYNMDHLLKYDEYVSMDDIKEYKTIVEVGGGYGDMAALIHSMGFGGDYYMLEFPEIIPLQKHFLNRLGHSHIHFVSDIKDLPKKCDLVIGTWSISEMEFEERDSLMKRLKTDHWLLTYQNNIFGNSNHKYFVDKFEDVDYAIDQIDYMPFDGGNNYLIV